MSFFEELKRRNVFRVGIAYGIAAWVLLQVADLVLNNINAPDWVIQAMMLVVALGFIAALVIAWAYEMTPEGLKKEADVERTQSIVTQTGRKMDRIIIGFLAVAVAVLLYRLAEEKPAVSDVQLPANPTEVIQSQSGADLKDQNEAAATQEQAAPADNRQSIAVLPFINMSDDAQNEYFSDGISEELLNVLVRIESLRVPSRTSSFTFKGSGKKVSEIGRELQVDHVLEGSVRKAGERIRVTAQLIDVRTDTHLWSDTYTRELDDIFAVQDEIAHAIVEALKVTLSSSEQQKLADHSTDNVEAYNKFLLGRHLWNLRTVDSLLQAVVPLREAVGLDPGFDRAWAALADAYVLIPEYGGGSINEYIPLARQATEKALLINPESARALTTKGYYLAYYDFDFPNSLASFERAIQIDPSYPTAHHWYAEVLDILRRNDEALEQIQIAIDLDPLAPVFHHVMGWFIADGDHPRDAIPYYRTALKLNPNIAISEGNLSLLYLKLGDYEQAKTSLKRFGELANVDVSDDLVVFDAVENPALRNDAVEVVKASTVLTDSVGSKGYYFMVLGEPDLALESIKKGLENGDPYAVQANCNPVYDPLRSDPRFQAHLKKMNLWP